MRMNLFHSDSFSSLDKTDLAIAKQTCGNVVRAKHFNLLLKAVVVTEHLKSVSKAGNRKFDLLLLTI